MKVAIVSQPWDTLRPPVSSGSIPIWTYETAKRLSQNCEVVLYARRNDGEPAQEVVDDIEYRRVSIAGNRPCNGIVKALAKAYRRFRYLNSRLYYGPYPFRVAADLRRQQCDIVHIHNFSQFVPAIRALNPRIKIVLHMHCEWLSQFEREAIASRLSQTDLIIGCSDYITKKVKARFPEFAHRCQRVYNGVDVSQFQTSPQADQPIDQQKVDQTEDDLNLLFVGRISPEKGLHTLLQAFEKIADDFPTAKLYLIGPDKPTTAEFIADLSDDPLVCQLADLDPPNYPQNLRNQVPPRLKDRIIFTGAISHLALHSHFQKAAVLVNPSLSEAFGMSLIEAMATGTPTVATQVGGMPDIVQPGKTGLLVPPAQPGALADALSTVLADKALRVSMGKVARQRAVETFSWEAIAADLLSHYQSLGVSP